MATTNSNNSQADRFVLISSAKPFQGRTMALHNLPSSLDSEASESTSSEDSGHRSSSNNNNNNNGTTTPPPSHRLGLDPPTDYQIVTEPCDWCMAETPWHHLHDDDDDKDDDGILASSS
jgi:hypothetical protein